jgi:uncharacterized membrane protein
MSLVVVILAFVEAEQSDRALQALLNASGIVGVLVSWFVVHTVFTLRYAHLYYTYADDPGGIDFPCEPDHSAQFKPDYHGNPHLAPYASGIRSAPVSRSALPHTLRSPRPPKLSTANVA